MIGQHGTGIWPRCGSGRQAGVIVDRRLFLIMGASFSVALPRASEARRGNWYIGTIPDQPFDIQIVDSMKVPPAFRRQSVDYHRDAAVGSIVVEKDQRFLFHITAPGKAVRYGVAVGRQGVAWRGEAVVGRKAKWPGWTPTERMRARDPSLPAHVPGGPRNPLGALALYLFKDGRDTLYRIHGTSEPWSIGKAASSGCIRLLDEHIFELYASITIGARVIVL